MLHLSHDGLYHNIKKYTNLKASFYAIVTKRCKMYHKTNTNKVNLFVRECICTATLELMKTMNYEDITVSAIIKKAGVSRMGFYRNYGSKEEAIEDFILTAFENTLAEIRSKRPLELKTYNVIVTVLENFRKYADYIKLFVSQKLDHLLFDCYSKAFDMLSPVRDTSAVGYYYKHMLLSNLFSVEMAWIRSGMKESPDELARIYSRILKMQSRI